MSLDLAALRADTPGVENVLHLNNAGASLQPRPVLDAVVRYLEREGAIGGYETADEYREELEGIYATIGRLIGSEPAEIAVLPSATVAWSTVFYGMRFGRGDRVLTTTSEYASNFIAYLHRRDRDGIEIDVVPDTPDGEIDTHALANMIDDRVKLISINHMPTQQGLINPAAEVGRVANAAGVPFLLDACQTVGQMPIDVDRIGCDFLSVTSRKYLRGPRGMGFMYVRSSKMDLVEPSLLDLQGAIWSCPASYTIRDDARRFESWEAPMAAKVGFHRAIRYALDVGLADAWERIERLAGDLRDQLRVLPGVTVTDRGRVQGGLVTFTLDGMTASDIQRHMRALDINVSTSTVASAFLDMTSRGLDEVVRASVHYFNTEEELARFTSQVALLAG